MVQPPGGNSRHWQPSTCSRECCARSRNASLAAMMLRSASSTTMPSSMLLITVSSRSRWLRTSPTRPVTESAMVLNSRASQEMRIGAFGRDALRQIAAGDLPRGGFEPLQPAQHGHPDHQSDGAHQQQRDGRGAAHQPAQVARHLCAQLLGLVIQDQDAVDLVARVVAAVAFRPVADGDHGAQHCRRRGSRSRGWCRAAPADSGGRPGRWAS